MVFVAARESNRAACWRIIFVSTLEVSALCWFKLRHHLLARCNKLDLRVVSSLVRINLACSTTLLGGLEWLERGHLDSGRIQKWIRCGLVASETARRRQVSRRWTLTCCWPRILVRSGRAARAPPAAASGLRLHESRAGRRMAFTPACVRFETAPLIIESMFK